MAQRVDERTPTRTELEAYNKCLKLNDHVLSVCKGMSVEGDRLYVTQNG